MNKLVDVERLLDDARDCIMCVQMAAADPGYTAIQTVAEIAGGKIDEAIELLFAYRRAELGENVLAARRPPKKRKGK